MKIKIVAVLNIVIVFFIFVFVFMVTRYTPPIGDDVLFTSTDSILHYLDDYDGDYGEKITNVQLLFESSIVYYTNWSGRVIGFMISALRSIFNDVFVGVFSGIVFVFSIIVCLLNINGSIKKIKPSQIIILFLVLYYFTEAAFFYYRFVFTSMYVLACAFIMLYYFVVTDKLDYTNEVDIKICLLLNIFGFFTGMQHEMFSALLCCMIFFQAVFNYSIKVKYIIRAILYNLGLLLGILAGVFSPGTFVRMAQSHSDGLQNSLAERFEFSFYIHIDVLTTNSLFGHALMIILIAFALITIIFIRKQNFLTVIKRNMGLISGAIASLVAWSFSPYIPNYGLLLYLMIALILILKNTATFEELNLSFLSKKAKSTLGGTWNAIIVIIAVLSMFYSNFFWINDLKATTVKREVLINQAIANNEDSVVVPAYPQSTSNVFTCYNYNNSPSDYESMYYQKYYGIVVVPESSGDITSVE